MSEINYRNWFFYTSFMTDNRPKTLEEFGKLNAHDLVIERSKLLLEKEGLLTCTKSCGTSWFDFEKKWNMMIARWNELMIIP